MAAFNDHSEAAYWLGKCYLNGQYVEKDYEQAIRFFKMAADNNHSEAAYWLGQCYLNGQGVDKDHNEALKYFQMDAEKKILLEGL